MGNNDRPTAKQLQELYQTAIEFKKREPWEYLYDLDLIGVENPVDQTMGYCSVMGKGGEHYALGVYLGDRGFAGFCRMLEEVETIPYYGMLHLQDCLMCSFEDRNVLKNEDRKQIKETGLSFRGRNAWPMFRRYESGYEPWFVNQAECVFLTHALQQVLFVLDEFSAGKLEVDFEKGRSVARHSRKQNGKLLWDSKELLLEVVSGEHERIVITDDLLIRKIKKAGDRGYESLQMDTVYMPYSVQEKRGERPYYPRAFLLYDSIAGQIVDLELYQGSDADGDIVINKLIDLCLKTGIPQTIYVRSYSMLAIVENLCQQVGIEVIVVEKLPIFDEIVDTLSI